MKTAWERRKEAGERGGGGKVEESESERAGKRERRGGRERETKLGLRKGWMDPSSSARRRDV